jgi:hypothetical protein
MNVIIKMKIKIKESKRIGRKKMQITDKKMRKVD